MLQQTTVQAVLPYYIKWTGLFPDVESLSRAPLQKVLKAWQGLGYYQRAKNIHKASRIIRENFKSRIPQKYDNLINLPGFGPYTTAAVLSFAFEKPFPVLDANVRRVLMRILRLKSTGGAKLEKKLSAFLKTVIPEKKPGLFNQAMMELGARICKPKNPLCLQCPAIKFCQAYAHGEQDVIPPLKKRNYQKIEAVVGIIKRNNKYLIQKRPPRGLLADLWEFPGGKRKAGETLENALGREIKEELGVDVMEAKFLTRVKQAYTQFQVFLHAYECLLKEEPHLKKGHQKWVPLGKLKQYPVPSGSAKIIRFLEMKDRNEYIISDDINEP